MLVLVDQDGVLADFDAGVNAALAKRHPHLRIIEPASRRSFRLRDDYPGKYLEEIKEIQASPGFILGLAPMPGALDAMHDMLAAGHDVRICTAPLTRFTNCVGEKFQWVHDHLGPAWVQRVVLTMDKTLVRGDVLLDDCPEVIGALVPTWEHVVFDAPYNVASPGRRLTWETWRHVLDDPGAHKQADGGVTPAADTGSGGKGPRMGSVRRSEYR